MQTYDGGGRGRHHAVQEEGGQEADLVGARVGLQQLGVVTEEALHVHAEQVRALQVVSQQHGGGHDEQLEDRAEFSGLGGTGAGGTQDQVYGTDWVEVNNPSPQPSRISMSR